MGYNKTQTNTRLLGASTLENRNAQAAVCREMVRPADWNQGSFGKEKYYVEEINYS